MLVMTACKNFAFNWNFCLYPADTGSKLNVHKTYVRLIYVLCLRGTHPVN